LGVVTDDTQNSLYQAPVKGTSKGTPTDADGKYLISAAVGDIYKFTFIDIAKHVTTINATS
jgi:iron complex outermembrane receptor protein